MPRKLSRGFTIMEVVVVIAILGILLALLLPAIQQSRETARRLQCTNNLRQIGVALSSYHTTFNCFPIGDFNLKSVCEATPDGWGWHVAILPELGQTPLFDKLSPNGEGGYFQRYYREHGEIIPAGRTVLSMYRCPSSSLADHAIQLGPYEVPVAALGYATTDYKGCNGGGLARGVFGPQSQYLQQKCPGRTPGATRRLRLNRCPHTLAHITDGASQTIAVGESAYPGFQGTAWPRWVGALGFPYEILFRADYPINCGVENFGSQYWQNAPDDGCAISFHPGGANFLFVDGSVKLLSESLSLPVFKGLAGVDDGRVVSNF